MNVAALFQYSRDRAAALSQQYGVFTSRSLIIVRRTVSGLTYLEIEPRPTITTISPRLANYYSRISSIQIELTDRQVKGISKRYTRSQLVGQGITYRIGAEMVDGMPIGGVEANLVPGFQLEERDLQWDLLLREVRR